MNRDQIPYSTDSSSLPHWQSLLQELLVNPQITEIILNGTNSIWYEESGAWHEFPRPLAHELLWRQMLGQLSMDCSLNTDLNTPCADGRWGEFRVHLITPPLASSAQLCLRRISPQPWTLARLAKAGWAEPERLRQLEQLIENRCNFLVIGPTGSGKTTVLDACLQGIGESERAICLEDTDELHLPNRASCKLLTRDDLHGSLRSYDLSDLLRQSLRMRPQRLVVGEVRGGEAKDLLLALATGHRGSMGTLHAESARQALLRLEMLVQLGAKQWDTQSVRQLIQLSLDALVVVEQHEGLRRLEGIYRLTALESFGFLLERD